MKVAVDVYTKDVDAATEVFKEAIRLGVADVRINTILDYATDEFKYINIMMEVDHSCRVLDMLDDGPFVKDCDDL